MKLGLRIFLCYLAIFTFCIYVPTNWMWGTLRTRYLEAVEEPLVDTANIVAGLIEDDVARPGFDPEPLRGLQPVAEQLGLVLMPGVVVDPRASDFRASPAFAVGTAAGYSPHGATSTLHLNTLFPYSRQVGVIESDEWRVTPLVEVAPRGWVETANPDVSPVFDDTRDIPGPITIAVGLERTLNDKPQRVVVFGNASFLSNTYLGNGGNLDLGVNLVNWLVGDDSLIAIQPRPGADSRLDIGPIALYLIAATFLAILPLAFMIAGVVIWWRRRRI